MRFFKNYIDGFLALAVGLVLTYLAGMYVQNPDAQSAQLEPPVNSQDYYIIGNSMFGTGFDLAAFRKSFPGKSADFAYYNGYYTSMWHLAVSVGMEKSTAPKTIIWGFRPTYANRPAFRQNSATKEQIFIDQMPTRHRQVLARAGDPAYAGSAQPQTPEQNDKTEVAEGQDFEPFQRVGTMLASAFKAPFAAMNGQNDVRATWTAQAASGFMKAVSNSFGPAGMIENDKPVKSSDLLIRYVTGGKIKTMDALVVDNGARFIQGVEVPFSQSFVPHIANQIRDLGADQIVVIYKPVSTFSEPLPAATQKYYDDAIKFFKARGIKVVDLMQDDTLTQNLYAKGDHFTQDGRALITRRITEKAKGR